MAATSILDTVVPEVFTPYTQTLTQEKSLLIKSGALVVSQQMSDELAGGGAVFNAPAFKDLANEDENISSDEEDDSFTGGSNNSTPKKHGTLSLLYPRLSRNQSWADSDLASQVSGADIAGSISGLVAGYWERRLQKAFISTVNGVFAGNAAAAVNGSTHTIGDLTNDISGTAYENGITNFGGDAFIDALVTAGDSMDNLNLMMVHSLVYARMLKNNLIEFNLDSEGRRIASYMDHPLVVDDGMPRSGGVFESWVFGSGAMQFGSASPKTPTEKKRAPDSGNGGGSTILYNRVEWGLHPTGHRYTGATPKGGPSNAATVNNLAHNASWARAYEERKQIKMARLVTREF